MTATGSAIDGRLRLRDRQREQEGDAAPREVLGPDASAVGADDALADRQAEAGAPFPVRPPAVELLEDLVFLAVRQVRAAVGDLHGGGAVGGGPTDLDRAARRHVLE